MKKVAIYNPYLNSMGGGEKVCLTMAELLSESSEVTLVSRDKADLDKLGDYFNLDLSKCKTYRLPNPRGFLPKLSIRLHFPGRLRNFIHERVDYNNLQSKNYDLFINHCYQSGMPCPAPKGIYVCMFPQELVDKSKLNILKYSYHKCMDLLEYIFYKKGSLNVLKTYDVVTVISEYTLTWLKKRWGQSFNTEILYPICDDMKRPGVPKEKIILNVGRFFADSGESHHKRQDKLLDAFKELTDLQKDGWQLHFVGSVGQEADDLKYTLKLIKAAKAMPIYFHLDAPYSELKSLYNKASIYWHATGWGSNAKEHPDKQEHFGISTVEAMSASAIPVVINTAGQKETVTHGKSGYLWSTKNELIKYTKLVANDVKAKQKMASSAKKEAKRFNKNAFGSTLFDIIDKYQL